MHSANHFCYPAFNKEIIATETIRPEKLSEVSAGYSNGLSGAIAGCPHFYW